MAIPSTLVLNNAIPTSLVKSAKNRSKLPSGASGLGEGELMNCSRERITAVAGFLGVGVVLLVELRDNRRRIGLRLSSVGEFEEVLLGEEEKGESQDSRLLDRSSAGGVVAEFLDWLAIAASNADPLSSAGEEELKGENQDLLLLCLSSAGGVLDGEVEVFSEVGGELTGIPTGVSLFPLKPANPVTSCPPSRIAPGKRLPAVAAAATLNNLDITIA